MRATIADAIGPRRRGVWLALVLLVGLAGCTTRATLTVTVRADGSGTLALRVALDREAVQAAQGDGTPLEQRVRLDDLRAGGWTVSRWTHGADGSARVLLTAPFSGPAQLERLVRELSGADGPLREVHASRTGAWLGVAHTVTVSGRVDLRDATGGVVSDQELVARLTAQRVDVGAIAQQLTGRVRTALSIQVVVAVPGQRQVRTVAAGRDAAVRAGATTVDGTRAALLAGSVLLAVLAALAWWRSRRVAARRAPSGRRRAP